MCSNQTAIAQVWPFLADEPPVLMDWLPWNHVFGGSFCFNLTLFHGGTFFLDDGKPSPRLIGRTVTNLREISPTMYLNVPLGYDMLLPHLERDAALRDRFFCSSTCCSTLPPSCYPHCGSAWKTLRSSRAARGCR
jgi:feruloyl-CoA synthase